MTYKLIFYVKDEGELLNLLTLTPPQRERLSTALFNQITTNIGVRKTDYSNDILSVSEPDIRVINSNE
jgi:hypothetical protein